MEERIKAQVKDSDPAEVKELILDNVRETSIVGLTDKFSSLATLSVIHVGLTSLDGLPALPSLTKLELGDNKLTGGLEALSKCPEIRHLSLVGNRLASVDLLAPLKGLEKLETLDLLDCPLTRQEDYRARVFALLPGLRSLDGLNQAGEEVEETDSEGEGQNNTMEPL
ncbi:Acidic leucine-rich nuclear phosphoprotein 32-related protein [Geodia barretti]|uniref:Acidic leucine-rich nuclear phosphoprotein 32-related protein n=1 Tax=Geodia barretti TaxID=519541 RepID=A0AA35TNA3_GEOBA|nr:Acidic leucine-rich nuclear phosphoprotein 32-related protein [Geodia barretti]